MTLLSHVIWDWNGTLLNDVQAALNAINQMLARRRLPQLDRARYRETFGFPVRNFYQIIGLEPRPSEWDAMAAEFHTLFLRDTSQQLHEHSLQALQHLASHQIKQSILSASEQGILTTMLQQYRIAHFFANVYGVANLDGASKLQQGAALLRRLAVDPDQILLIGDSLHDFEVAENLAVNCLLIAQGHQSSARLQTCGVPVLSSLEDLPAWLRGNFSVVPRQS